jgi:hypothetical protein
VVGLSASDLTLKERLQLAGKWVAFEIYTPENLAERKIQAIGDSAAECMKQLNSQGLDPRKFEFVPLNTPY